MRVRKRPALRTAIALLAIAGCSDDDGQLVLAGSDLELAYECEAAELLAESDEEREIVRKHAVSIIQHADDRSDLESIGPLMEAYEEEDPSVLEQLVVRRLCDHPEEVFREPRFPEPGSEAPALALPLVAAPADMTLPEQFELADFRGQYVLIDFWATWCGPCRRKYPGFADVVDQYQGRGFTAVAVLHQERPSRAVRWLEAHGGVRYPLVNDPRSAAARSWGISGIPQMFLIDPRGRVVQSCVGCQTSPMSSERLPALLDELLES